MKEKKAIEITFKNGTKKQYESVSAAARDLDIYTTTISMLLQGFKDITSVRELNPTGYKSTRVR